jgi:hypothetical protein
VVSVANPSAGFRNVAGSGFESGRGATRTDRGSNPSPAMFSPNSYPSEAFHRRAKADFGELAESGFESGRGATRTDRGSNPSPATYCRTRHYEAFIAEYHPSSTNSFGVELNETRRTPAERANFEARSASNSERRSREQASEQDRLDVVQIHLQLCFHRIHIQVRRFIRRTETSHTPAV